MPEAGRVDVDAPAPRNFDMLHGTRVAWIILFRYWRLLVRPGAPPPDDGPCGPFRAGYSSIAMQSDEEDPSEPP